MSLVLVSAARDRTVFLTYMHTSDNTPSAVLCELNYNTTWYKLNKKAGGNTICTFWLIHFDDKKVIMRWRNVWKQVNVPYLYLHIPRMIAQKQPFLMNRPAGVVKITRHNFYSYRIDDMVSILPTYLYIYIKSILSRSEGKSGDSTNDFPLWRQIG